VLLAPGTGLLAVAVCLLGTAFASWMIPPVLLLHVVPPAGHARALGVYRFTTDVAFVAGPVVLAAAYERVGPVAAALLGGFVPLAAVAAMLLGRRGAGAAARPWSPPAS
jgi:predicted MFS family arabinose efflux permease